MLVSMAQNTVYVPSSELGLSQPLPPEPGGGGHIRLRVRGWGSSNSDDWRKSLALCLLCGPWDTDFFIQKMEHEATLRVQ
jgi:hypothetical protein